MKRELSAIEARQKFDVLLDQAYYRDDQIIIKRADKPIAVLVSIQAYQQFLMQRDKDLSILARVWDKVPDVPEEEVENDIAAAIAEVRSARSASLNQINQVNQTNERN
jgi:prevent-host-death family protein